MSTTTAPATSTQADDPQLSAADVQNLEALASSIATDESLSAGVRVIASQLLTQAADRQRALTNDTEYLSPNKACHLVGVSRPLFNRLLDEGRIPFYSTPGGHRKVRRSDVLEYVAHRDEVAGQLAAARRDRSTIEQRIAAESGMSPEKARRLGLG